MKRITYLLFVFVMLLASCMQSQRWHSANDSESYHVGTMYVCVSVPPAMEPAVWQAVAQWDSSLKNWHHLEAVRGYDVACRVFVFETNTIPDWHPSAIAWTSAVGCATTGTPCNISLIKTKYERYAEGIVAHEIGHAFGAQHVAKTLMNKEYDRDFTCPDAVTVAQVAAWNHINAEKLSYCQ